MVKYEKILRKAPKKSKCNPAFVIVRAAADIAMFQEVVPTTLRLIESQLSKDYHIIHSGTAAFSSFFSSCFNAQI